MPARFQTSSFTAQVTRQPLCTGDTSCPQSLQGHMTAREFHHDFGLAITARQDSRLASPDASGAPSQGARPTLVDMGCCPRAASGQAARHVVGAPPLAHLDLPLLDAQQVASASVGVAFLRPARPEFPMRTVNLIRRLEAMSGLQHLRRKFVGGTAESAALRCTAVSDPGHRT
jgi:hypothetical protein